MENWNTYYDEYKFIEEEIAWFQQNKQEFLVSILWDEDRKVESITDKEIEDHFYNDHYIGENHWEYFREDLESGLF